MADQHPCDYHDGQKESQQNVPPSHDQSLLLGPGKLTNLFLSFDPKSIFGIENLSLFDDNFNCGPNFAIWLMDTKVYLAS